MSLEKFIEAADKHEVFADRLDKVELDGCKFHFSAKDNLCSTEFQARAGSRILEG